VHDRHAHARDQAARRQRRQAVRAEADDEQATTRTIATATSRLRMVTGTLYWMVWPGIVNPSMAMKCMT
jgi:hypothetical protein